MRRDYPRRSRCARCDAQSTATIAARCFLFDTLRLWREIVLTLNKSIVAPMNDKGVSAAKRTVARRFVSDDDVRDVIEDVKSVVDQPHYLSVGDGDPEINIAECVAVTPRQRAEEMRGNDSGGVESVDCAG
jgi:hypothetical protein